MIEKAFKQLESYISYITREEIPVLRKTARDLEHLREDIDHVSGRKIASVVLQDPLMAVRVLTYLEARRRASQNHDITTVDRAIMMLGINPFFEKFSSLPILEEHFVALPKALVGLLRVISRAKRAAQLARDWAVVRHDLDVDEVTVAALLHEAAEILLWTFAPTLMLEIADIQNKNPTARSATTQKIVLGVTINEIQHKLVEAWNLPELLITLMDDEHATNPRIRNVILAINLARHSSHGWEDPAIPDDLVATCDLLHIGLEALLNRIGVPQEYWPKLYQEVNAKNPSLAQNLLV